MGAGRGRRSARRGASPSLLRARASLSRSPSSLELHADAPLVLQHAIACRVTDSWDASFHSSLNQPIKLVTAHDTRLSTGNVLSHAAANAIDAVAYLDMSGSRPPLSYFGPEAADPPYLLTGLSVFLSHEPCLLCAMSLLHSRIKALYYIKRAPGAGGAGSLYSVHEDGGLNHRFEVWEWTGPSDGGMGKGRGEELRLDP